jgi:hypothetical protein
MTATADAPAKAPVQPNALTPAEHRALAELDLHKTRSMTPGTPAYAGLVQSAIAHSLLGVVGPHLETLVSYMDPGNITEPEVRLPGGWVIRARQASEGKRQWGYVVTDGGGTEKYASEYRWGNADTALAAGTSATMGETVAGVARAARIARGASSGNGSGAPS